MNGKEYRAGQYCWTDDKNCLVRLCGLREDQQVALCSQFLPISNSFLEGPHPFMPSCEEAYIELDVKIEISMSKLRHNERQKLPPIIGDWLYSSDNTIDPVKLKCFAFSKRKRGRVPPATPGKPAPSVLELFAGAGGMSQGLHNAGMAPKWIVENNKDATATFKANFSSNPVKPKVYQEDVRSFLDAVQNGNSAAYRAVASVDHIHASPPVSQAALTTNVLAFCLYAYLSLDWFDFQCQGMSSANREEGGGPDGEENNLLTHQFTRAVMLLKPQTATYENVPNLLTKAHFRPILKEVVSKLMSMGYQVRVEVLKASDYGDPQHRNRLFLWAAKSGMILPSAPAPTHGSNLLPIRTVADVIGCYEDCNVLEGAENTGSVCCKNGYADDHLCAWPGGNVLKEDRQLHRTQPATTITSRPHPHYSGRRFLTVRESACLQSFPSSFTFCGSLDEQYRQIGNAVPVSMATHVARSVALVHGLP